MCSRTSSNKKPCRRDMAFTISSSACKWANLPRDLHYLILDKLLDPFDHLRFPVVCKGWQAAAKCYNISTHRWHNKALPSLLIPPITFPTHRLHKIDKDPRLHSVFEKTVYKNVFFRSRDFLVSSIVKCSCSGSDGWLALTCYGDDKQWLVNIFRKSLAPICLPRFRPSKLYNLEERYVSSITMSVDPLLNPESFTVIVVFSRSERIPHLNPGTSLALTKGGQNFWTHIVSKYELQGEAILYKDRVYAVRKEKGSIMLLDVNNEPLELAQVTPNLNSSEIFDKEYLVKSAKGDFLWHVRKRRVWNNQRKSDNFFFALGYLNVDQARFIENFRVYKVMIDNEDDSIVKQVEVKSIGDEALFVGGNECYSILASSFPMCQKNSIYYTIDSRRSRKDPCYEQTDVSIFNLEDCSTNITPFTPASIYGIPMFWTIPPFSGLY